MAKKPVDDVAGVWEIVRNAVYLVRNTGWLGVVMFALIAVREGIQYAGPPMIQAFVMAAETNKMLVPLLQDRVEAGAENKKSLNSINENLQNLTTAVIHLHEEIKSLKREPK